MRPGREADRRSRRVTALAFLVATALHVAVALLLGLLDISKLTANASNEMEYVELDPFEAEAEPEPAPATEPEPELEPEPRPRPTPSPERPPEANEPEAEPPPPAAETPVDLTQSGLVLSNESGSSSFQVSQGDGSDREGPITTPGAEVTGRSRQGVPGGTPGGTGSGPPTPVPVSSLGRRPEPPSQGLLDRLLAQSYPPEARAQGVSGRAYVRFVLRADGQPTGIQIRGESVEGYGFGAACARVVRAAGRWGAPLDANGNPTATIIPSFRCDFDVQR